MKKKRVIFLSMLVAVILAVAIEPAFAAGGKVAYNQAGVRFFDQQVSQAGEIYAAPDGRQVPSSITYTDAAGNETIYLSIDQIAELMDADICWDSESGNVEIAAGPKPGTSDITITTNAEETSDKEDKIGDTQVRQYGQVVGPFEEIDPKDIETVIAENPYPFFYMKDTHIQSEWSMPHIRETIEPVYGEYLVYTVTNNGTSNATSSVFRQPTVAYPKSEYFPRVTAAPGETLVRVFKVAEGENPLTYDLNFAFNAVGGPAGNYDYSADMTFSLEQYP